MLESESYVRVIALDFSKAFDTVRHAQLIDKLSELSIPNKINGWMASFLRARTPTTTFENQTSSSCTINASVHGSAIGRPAFIITASDLIVKHSSNALNKFADDTYLVIPASNVHSTEDELTNVEIWAAQNNLKLNRSKSKELLLYLQNR
jgi:stage V sporulation protein SpoVS